MADFILTQNDTFPPIRGTCLDENGDPVNLTGASVRFIMQPQDSETDTVDAAGVIADADAGIVYYDWQAADTAVAGSFFAEFEVTYSTGKVETFPRAEPLVILIRADLA